jgi:nucleotide-binding universal stress UspA family protein
MQELSRCWHRLIYRKETYVGCWLFSSQTNDAQEGAMYKRIVVPIDLSQADQGKTMVELAKKVSDPSAEIFLVNVIEELPSYIVSELPGGIRERSVENAKATLEDIAEDAGINTPVFVRTGRVSTEIIGVADEHDADLIIIASHSPGLQDYLLGSTAARVVRHSKHSVLVMR